MKDVLGYFEIDVPEIKKGDSLKPKKPPRKDSEGGPEPPKKQKDESEGSKEEPKTEQKPKSEEKGQKSEGKKEEL